MGTDTSEATTWEIALLDARRRGRDRRMRTSSQALVRLARRFSAEGDPRQLLQEIMAEAVVLVGADDAAISSWDEQRGVLMTVTSLVPPSFPGIIMDARNSVSGRAAASRRPQIVND